MGCRRCRRTLRSRIGRSNGGTASAALCRSTCYRACEVSHNRLVKPRTNAGIPREIPGKFVRLAEIQFEIKAIDLSEYACTILSCRSTASLFERLEKTRVS